MTVGALRKLLVGRPDKMKVALKRNSYEQCRSPDFLDQPNRGRVIPAVRWPAGSVSENPRGKWNDHPQAKHEKVFLIGD